MLWFSDYIERNKILRVPDKSIELLDQRSIGYIGCGIGFPFGGHLIIKRARGTPTWHICIAQRD